MRSANNLHLVRIGVRAHSQHRLAHIAAPKGPRARYRGTRKNLFDLRRAAVIQNLEAIQLRKAGGGK